MVIGPATGSSRIASSASSVIFMTHLQGARSEPLSRLLGGRASHSELVSWIASWLSVGWCVEP
jgi:hypothetical protein